MKRLYIHNVRFNQYKKQFWLKKKCLDNRECVTAATTNGATLVVDFSITQHFYKTDIDLTLLYIQS